MGMTDKTAKERRARGIAINNPKYKSKTAAHKKSVARFKTGTHPQMWRKTKHRGAGMRLGPMGALGNDIIIEVRYKYNFPKTIRELSQNVIVGLLGKKVHEPLLKYMREKNDIWVPKETGGIRDSISGVLDGSTPTLRQISTTVPYRMMIGTPNIDYAGPVNKMPTSWLVHNNQPSRLPGYTLNDPNAKKEWFNLLRLNGRNKARRLWSDFLKTGIEPIIRPLAKSLKVTNISVFAKGLFIVRFI